MVGFRKIQINTEMLKIVYEYQNIIKLYQINKSNLEGDLKQVVQYNVCDRLFTIQQKLKYFSCEAKSFLWHKCNTKKSLFTTFLTVEDSLEIMNQAARFYYFSSKHILAKNNCIK